MSSPFFFTITKIGDARGDIDGRMIFCRNNFLINSVSLYMNFGATGRTRWAIGVAPPTSISHTAPLAAGANAFPFIVKRYRFSYFSRRCFSWSLDILITGSPTCILSIVISIDDWDISGKNAICWSTSSHTSSRSHVGKTRPLLLFIICLNCF